MFQNPYIASGGQDLFPLVIIIVAVLAQIIKAAKGAKPTIGQPDQHRSGAGSSGAPADELRKFLESLSGGTVKSVNVPPPLPPAAPRPQARKVREQMPVEYQTVHVKMPMRESAYDIPDANNASLAAAAPRLPEPARLAAVVDAYDKIAVSLAHKATFHFRSSMLSQLVERDALKKAIVLREILGPCIALRQPER